MGVDKMVAGLSIREPEEVGITDVRVISELALKLKMLDATSFFPEYKSFKNKLTTKKPSKWLALTRDQIVDELKTIHDNTTSFGRQPGYARSQSFFESWCTWTEQECTSQGLS